MAENRKRVQNELKTDAAMMVAGAGVASVGKKVAGRAIAAASVNTADAASTYTRALQDGTRAAMRVSVVDFKDPKAVATWVKENPDIMADNSKGALQSAGAIVVSKIAGGKAGDFVKNPVGSFVAEQTVGEGVKEIMGPYDSKY